MPPRVSVILTTHGMAPYLKQAIGSLLSQTMEDWQLIIARDWIPEQDYNGYGYDLDDRIENHPFSVPDGIINRYAYTINRAFPKCKAKLISYLCHDDLYLPWRLEGMAYALDVNQDAHVVYGQQQMMAEEDGITRLTGVRDTVGVTLNAAFQIDHSSVMHRRECFEAVGGWDESAPMRAGDAGFWNRLNAAGYAFYPIAVPMDCHRYNSESVTYKIDHPEKSPGYYPPYDDLGNKRTINNAVDAGWSAE